ncbi:hypothetical protein Pan241w_18000 [Gimesia alba]|uniref:Carboxypeptidase regulatory-like domain-containing protein n=1 Tax=Gimesia alba TaxID=2527973 RepID=A0A517RCX5_9PLAN|nr:carboxypeptidase-like regulatory domain-containing protein [Gimesia alba]QDT41737.1 hypothetical protein Pan241w_18000 [Gimesia alba]
MTNTVSHLKLAVILHLSILFYSCGGSEKVVPDKLTEVSGVVTLDGKSLASASVIFTPYSGTKGNGAFGVTDSDGKYTLQHKSGKPGIEPGKYYVIFSKWAMPNGSPIPAGKSAADVEAKQVIPKKYLAVTKAGRKNIAEVTGNASSFDFDLKSK